jgi:hypothetical protein
MTSEQKQIVTLYSVINVILFVIVVVVALNMMFGHEIRKFLNIHEPVVENLDDADKRVDYLDLDIPVYIQNVARPDDLLDLVICVPLDFVPDSLKPETLEREDDNGLNDSVATVLEFPDFELAQLEV